jgi:hypothetical protein
MVSLLEQDSAPGTASQNGKLVRHANSMNNLHPMFHGQSYHAGSRIDIERLLPTSLDDEDLEMLLEDFSEPSRFSERLSPVGMQLGDESVRGKNFTDMLIKSYRMFGRIYSMVTMSIEQALRNNFRERGMVPFQSMGLDIDFLHRIIEDDHAISENTYGKLMELFSSGVISPCATTPFHTLLPRMQREFDIRLLIKMGLKLYWPILRDYFEYISEAHEEPIFSACFWLPEGGFNNQILHILHEEFTARAAEEDFPNPHLILLLDNQQATNPDNDILMKSWNVIDMPDGDQVSVVFRDRFFSDWVTYSNPSVKKLLDRTIAKVDSELNGQDVDYGWAHFEDVEALGLNGKAALNFEQKIIKLTELRYLPLAPDVMVRRKMLKRMGLSKTEPLKIAIRDETAWNDWHLNNVSLGRWDGTLDSKASILLVDENRPYVRRTRGGRINEQGHQCWKIAYNKARDLVSHQMMGDPETMTGGLLGVLAGMVPGAKKKPELARRNVMAFLTEYSMIYWREHYIEHDMSEAEIQLDEIAQENLLADCKGELTEDEIITAGVAAQGYYFMLDGYRSLATSMENFDQRAMYQNVVMTTLGTCNLMYILHWLDQQDEAKECLAVLKEHFLNFEASYDRYRLASYGVTRDEWKNSIKSEVPDCDLNVIERATRRVAARHLRALGYRRDFSKEDEAISTNCGHLWTTEIENSNYRWENKTFCGVREE